VLEITSVSQKQILFLLRNPFLILFSLFLFKEGIISWNCKKPAIKGFRDYFQPLPRSNFHILMSMAAHKAVSL
jgi:hypothetical protein